MYSFENFNFRGIFLSFKLLMEMLDTTKRDKNRHNFKLVFTTYFTLTPDKS